MTLLFTMLPVYILGNLHCMGMCGPLVMMIGQHRFRYLYFLGRTFSFTFAGMVAGQLGAVLDVFVRQYHIPAVTSFLFGGLILVVGICSLFRWQYPGNHWIAKKVAGVNQSLSLLMLRDQPWSTFLFGFFTIFLPCGQTVIVFSACALAGNLFVGLVNGLAFALLTSPSLFLAMHAHLLLGKVKRHYNTVMGVCAILIGGLALCRGLAETGLISHWVLNPDTQPQYHLVIY